MSGSEPNTEDARSVRRARGPIATARLVDDVPAAHVVLPRRPTHEALGRLRAQEWSHDIQPQGLYRLLAMTEGVR